MNFYLQIQRILFCLEGTRRINENQKAFLAQKGILDDQNQKKVRFDEKSLTKIRNTEMVPHENKLKVDTKKERVEYLPQDPRSS